MTPKDYIEKLHNKSTQDLQNAIDRSAPEEQIWNIEDKLRVQEETLVILNKAEQMEKDKSRFIELPCKVGDVVYFIGTGNSNIIKPMKITSAKITEDGVIHYIAYKKIEDLPHCAVGVSICFTIHDMNERGVFLTPEEAEKAVKTLNHESEED